MRLIIIKYQMPIDKKLTILINIVMLMFTFSLYNCDKSNKK